MKKLISVLMLVVMILNCINISAFSAISLEKPKVTVTSKNTTATVKWEAVEGATVYAVYYKQKGESKFTKLATTKKYKYTIKNLDYGTYYFCVRAVAKENGKTIATATSSAVKATLKNPYKQKTIKEFTEYLQDKYSVLKTPLGDIKVNFDHYTDNSALTSHYYMQINGESKTNYVFPYDYSLKCCAWIFFDGVYKKLQRGTITQEEYDITLGATAYLQQCIYKEAKKYLSGKKIECSMAMYAEGQNRAGQPYFKWTNYSPNDYFYDYFENQLVDSMIWKRAENGGDYFVVENPDYYISKYLEYKKNLKN